MLALPFFLGAPTPSKSTFFLRLASKSKSLAQKNKCSDGGKATNQQTYRALTLSVFIRTRVPCPRTFSQSKEINNEKATDGSGNAHCTCWQLAR
jgi:hypothetical protein